MINEDISRMTDIIVQEYQPDEIILFGSHARGEGTDASDVDLLVLSDREHHLPRFKRGLSVRIKLSEITVPKDILFYTHEDFNKWRTVPQSLVSEILREGVVLYER